MRELLTQKEQRQLRILEYLFENPSWIHLDPLAETLGINSRMISRRCVTFFLALRYSLQLLASD